MGDPMTTGLAVAFLIGLGVLAAICALLFKLSSADKTETAEVKTPEYRAFQWQYLAVYFIAMGADWLQGPYVYALYKDYKFTDAEIGQLFVAGFSSSALFGTFIGGLADKWGRRRMAQAYCVIYGLSCLTKLYNSYAILMVGRLLAGVATSLLYSAFESWLVSEHTTRFPTHSIGGIFSLAIFGNGLVAIGSGLAASAVAPMFGFVSPFILALVVLVVCFFLIQRTWSENYGDSTIDVSEGFRAAVDSVKETKVWLLGLVTSLFEGSMFTFVFMWSPVLMKGVAEANITEVLPFGIIFSCFMVCIMIGSSLFSMALSRGYTPHDTLRAALILGLASLATPLLTSDWRIVTMVFLTFEVACGLYFPSAGTLRGAIIPEHSRAGVMNFYRIPLNLLVVLVLLNVDNMTNYTKFTILTIWLGMAIAAHQILSQIVTHEAALESKTDETKPDDL